MLLFCLIGCNFLRSYPFYPLFGGKIRGEMEIAFAVQFSFFCGKHESGNGSCQGMALCHYPALRDACTLCTQKHTAKSANYIGLFAHLTAAVYFRRRN
jgi:hypothetical protein